MTERRSKTDIERRDDVGQGSSHRAANKLEQAFHLLTEEERLVLIWKKAGFSEGEIADHLSRTSSHVRETYRRGASKIRQSLKARRHTDASDDDLPLNCPLCGAPVVFRGLVNNSRVFTCAAHGAYCIERSGHFRRATDYLD